MRAACYQYFYGHPSIHADWKRQQLGEERFEDLRLRSQQIVVLDLSAIKAAIELDVFTAMLGGEVTVPLKIHVQRISSGARAKVEAAGGTVEII